MLHGSWFYLSEFPLVQSFIAEAVQGQETAERELPGVGWVSPTVSGGGSVPLGTMELGEFADLHLVARSKTGNSATEILIGLEDVDGTTLTWRFSTTSYSTTEFKDVSLPMGFAEAGNAGTAPGMDWGRVSAMVVRGNYSDIHGLAPMLIQFDKVYITVPELDPSFQVAIIILVSGAVRRGGRWLLRSF